jgi:hypothetical protein
VASLCRRWLLSLLGRGDAELAALAGIESGPRDALAVELFLPLVWLALWKADESAAVRGALRMGRLLEPAELRTAPWARSFHSVGRAAWDAARAREIQASCGVTDDRCLIGIVLNPVISALEPAPAEFWRDIAERLGKQLPQTTSQAECGILDVARTLAESLADGEPRRGHDTVQASQPAGAELFAAWLRQAEAVSR